MECNAWKNKTVCFLGDSITDGVGVNPAPRYFDLLADEFGFCAHGYGQNGAPFYGLLAQAQRMEAELGDRVDAVFLFAGTNDFNGSLPLGEWYRESEQPVVRARDESGRAVQTELRRMREAVCTPDTFRGSINCVLDFVKHRYARRQIVLMTPIHRAYACFGPTNIQYDERYANGLGLYIDDYTAVVREAARVWSTELIDLEQASGLFPRFDESAVYFANAAHDRLHPGPLGHQRLARVIAAKLPGIPLF